MSSESERSAVRWPAWGAYTQAALFFLAVFIYLRNGIDPRLIYHWQGPAFYTYPGFAGEFLRYPGGVADYLYGLIAQCYAWRDWGALVLTAEIAAACALGALLVQRPHGKTRLLPALVPALLLLYHANLYYDAAPVRIALVIGLGCAVAFGRLMPSANRPAAWFGLFAVFLAASYYSGGTALVFFAPLAACALWVRAAPNWPIAVRIFLCGAALAVATGLPVAVETYRLLEVRWPAASWFWSSDMSPVVVFWGLSLWAAAVAGMSLRRVASGVSGGPAASDNAGSAEAASRRTSGRAQRSQAAGGARLGAAWRQAARLGQYAFTALLFGALAGVMGYSYQAAGRDRRLAALDYFTWSEDWEAAVRTAEALKPGEFNSLSRYQVNLALHELGRMGDEMFRFPQNGGPLLELQVNSFLPYMLHLTSMCLRLGRVNEAEHYGSEALVFRKTDPRVYRLLALTYLVKGQTEAARKFLTVLSYSPPDRRWANQKLQALQQDPQLSGDEQVQQLRRRRLQADDMLTVWQRANRTGPDIERLLLNLLERDSSNRMAFEFLMGYYLLNRDLQGFRGLAPRIAEMAGPGYVRPSGVRRTPRHYQEALALFIEMTGSSEKIAGVEIEPETVSRTARFKQVVARAGGKRAAMLEAREGFGDTYLYYYAFGSESPQ
ncbi:MAG: DUF6057 family protein [Bryobacteraceae bacterium]|nr:DUF6057 family protein [Bryobacteraceae bacterium]